MDKKIASILKIKDTPDSDRVQDLEAGNDDDDDDDDVDDEEEENPENGEDGLAETLGIDEREVEEIPRGFLANTLWGHIAPQRTRKKAPPSRQSEPSRTWMLAVTKLFQSRVLPLEDRQ